MTKGYMLCDSITLNVQNRQIYIDKKCINVYQRLGGGWSGEC